MPIRVQKSGASPGARLFAALCDEVALLTFAEKMALQRALTSGNFRELGADTQAALERLAERDWT